MKRPHYLILLPLLSLLAAACSTTSALPDDEQLYTGIKKITYADDPALRRTRKGRDSVGVITAVGNAVEAVSQALQGKGGSLTDALQPTQPLTKEEIKEAKRQQAADEADFATAKAEVDAVLAYPPNNALFGSSYYHSPLQVGLWLHNGLADAKGKLGQWIFRHFATDPVLLSQVNPQMRAKVATNTLHNYGYFKGRVNYEVLTAKNPRKAKVRYDVRAGDLYRLDSVAYVGFLPAIDSLLRQHSHEALLHRGDAFSVVNLAAEQTRIAQLLRNNGYYYFNPNYTTFRADTVMRRGHVQLQVVPADNRSPRADRPWYIGRTYVSLRAHEGDVIEHTLLRRNYTYYYSGEKMPLRANLWRHAIAHRKGERYRQIDESTTLEKLGAMGVLSHIDLSYTPRDTTDRCDTLDVLVTAVMDKLYDSTFEMNATLKSNQQVGPGVAYELAKRNAFRGGEKVSFRIFGSYEWQMGAGARGGNSLLNSYELGTQLSLKFPRFLFPGVSRKRMRFYNQTEIAVDADWKNRSNFYNMVSMGLGITYSWHRRARSQHELTLFNLSYDKLLHTTHGFDSIMTANPALYISMRDQFVPSMSYTFTYQSSRQSRRPWWLQVTAKEAGNVTSAIYALCGESLHKRGKQLFGNPFAQYLKVTAEAHKSFVFNSNLKLATRLFGGVIYSYGNSHSAPYSDLFYVGGANSVRAFTVRSLGPGSFRAANTRYAYMDQTGDVKLEANAELRARLFGDLHGAVFLDAGNVWLLRDDANRPGGRLTAETLRRIALGTGAGLRYDLDFIVIRFDVGIALHAPYDTRKRGFYNIEKFKDGLAFHFAIGYPF